MSRKKITLIARCIKVIMKHYTTQDKATCKLKFCSFTQAAASIQKALL